MPAKTCSEELPSKDHSLIRSRFSSQNPVWLSQGHRDN